MAGSMPKDVGVETRARRRQMGASEAPSCWPHGSRQVLEPMGEPDLSNGDLAVVSWVELDSLSLVLVPRTAASTRANWAARRVVLLPLEQGTIAETLSEMLGRARVPSSRREQGVSWPVAVVVANR